MSESTAATIDERAWVAWGFANFTLPEARRRLRAVNVDRKARGEEPLGEPPFTGPSARTFARHRRADVTVGSVFRKGDHLYTVVGIADEPTVEIRDVVSGAIENHVISSLNFAEYEHLRSNRLEVDQ